MRRATTTSASCAARIGAIASSSGPADRAARVDARQLTKARQPRRASSRRRRRPAARTSLLGRGRRRADPRRRRISSRGAPRARATRSRSSSVGRGRHEIGRRVSSACDGAGRAARRRAGRTSSTSTPSTCADLGDAAGRPASRRAASTDELVDGPAAASLEDVDADDVAPHRADPARHRAQRTRTVGQPDAQHVRRHGRRRYGARCERPVSGRRST